MSPGRIKIGERSFQLPASRIARIGIGILLVLGGLVGFLPIVGFWMIPLGLLVISYDVAILRALRRRLVVWWGRRRGMGSGARKRQETAAGEPPNAV
jgi:hypothetical protein